MKSTLLPSALMLSFLMCTLSAFSQTTGCLTDVRDGQTYKTVKIGNQVWMAENLNYKTDSGSWAYDNNDSIAGIYGRLYNWETAEKVCPSGWHLPGDTEWTALSNYLGGDMAGVKLKEAGITHWNSPNEGATNESRFTALPGGFRDKGGFFAMLGNNGYWWCATVHSPFYALYRTLYNDLSDLCRYNFDKENGLSVRCTKDRD